MSKILNIIMSLLIIIFDSSLNETIITSVTNKRKIYSPLKIPKKRIGTKTNEVKNLLRKLLINKNDTTFLLNIS